MLLFVTAVASALIISFFCSISEASLLSVGHAQVQALRRSRARKILEGFKKEIDVPIAAILVVNTIANTIGAAVAGGTYVEVFDESTLWLFSLVFTFAILLFSEIIPKTLGVTFASKVIVPVAYSVRVLVVVLKPALMLTRALARALQRGHTSPVTSAEEIRLLAVLGRTEGALTQRMAGIIEGAAALRELTTYDVMVPRNGVTYLSGAATFEENMELIRRAGHSRFPFTPDGDFDHVEGIVLVKDLLFHVQEFGPPPDYRPLLGRALFVPQSMRLELLLRTFQEERRHMAIVVDEFGGAAGIVTLEDVLEELVGDIQDESDRLNPQIVRRSDGSLVCRGWAETRKLFELLGVEAVVETVSLGGFIAELLGRVPRVDDEVTWEGYTFKVLRASSRRAERVLVVPNRAPEQDGSSEKAGAA